MITPRAAAPTALLLLLAPALSGCLAGTEDAVDPASDVGADLAFTPCEHPWPCADGTEWPTDLEGPFDLLEPKPLRVPGHDGVELEAHVWLPDLPDGVGAPVVVFATPYPGQCYMGVLCDPPGNDPYWIDTYRLRSAAESGYAVVILNVRGTGTSGGCLELGGPNEGRDLALAVEWLAGQPWSNGRVAMTGLSYMGMTPFLAANHNPPALKTIVPGGILTDWYTFTFTPQGAADPIAPPFNTLNAAGLAGYPPLGAPRSLPAWLPVAAERACPGLADHFLVGGDHARDDRHAEHWKVRRLIDGAPNVTAAVFVYHGLRDTPGHTYQEDALWNALAKAPKRMLLGHWGHMPPVDGVLADYPGGNDWEEIRLAWLDFWLKGLGEAPPRLGTVDYQATDGTWRGSTSWPPADRRDEALYLTGGALAAEPQKDATRFVATPRPPSLWSGFPGSQATEAAATTPYCGHASATAVFTTPPVGEPATLAGNPFAYLQVESDQAGGIVAVDVYDLGPDARCEDGELADGMWLAGGAADLRFHEGNYRGEDFPMGEATPVRVDVFNLVHTVEEGHRVAVVASGHGHQVKLGQPYAPTITLHGDGSTASSHVVLPVVEGTLGGEAADVDYPRRPFVPEVVP